MQGRRLGIELVRPNLLERLRLDEHNSIEEIKVPASFAGQTLRELNLRRTYKVSVLAAGPANRLTVNPPASQVLEEGQVLVVMGSCPALEALPSQ
jgi:trk system potassium uptake protein TrkA